MLNFLKYSLTFCLSLMAIASLAWLVIWKTQDAKLYSVQSSSMAPAIQRGDLVVDTRTKPVNLKPGDLVSYYSPAGSGEIITHRVVANYLRRGYLITKGDSLSTPDPLIPYKSVLGKTFKTIPKAGFALNKLHDPAGLIVFIYLPAAIICAAELWLLTNRYRYRAYQLI